MRERVSQEISAPFCVVPNQSSRHRGTPWPWPVLLLMAGLSIVGLGLWDLVQSLPDYSVSVVIILIGGVPLLMALNAIRRLRADTGYWLGCDDERFTFASGNSISSWQWSAVDRFRVVETIDNGFVVTRGGGGWDERVDFKQTRTVTLLTNALDGTQINIPFAIFMPDGGRDLDQAENFSRFMNDVRHRGQVGDLAKGSAPFLAPADLTVVPMKDGWPDLRQILRPSITKPAVQRR